ncbi:MAG: ABC transporter substrate-binding protein, partial [bacterium]
MVQLLVAVIILLTWLLPAASAEPSEIKIGYLRSNTPRTSLSLVESPAQNDGLAGAQLGVIDNNTTGSFMGQQFSLSEMRRDPRDSAAAASELANSGVRLIITDLPADALLAAADAGAPQGLNFLNASAIDDRLREEACRANVIHTAPTRSMLADALAQYLVWKQWRRWLLVVGSHAEDQL